MTTETAKSPVDAFLAGETLWLKGAEFEAFGLKDAHEAFKAAKAKATADFVAQIHAKFPAVPAGKTLEAFPGKFGSFGLKLAEPKAARVKAGKAAPDLSALSMLLGPDKATVKGVAPKRK